MAVEGLLYVHGSAGKNGLELLMHFLLEGEIKTDRYNHSTNQVKEFFPFLFSFVLMIECAEVPLTGNLPTILA